MLTERRTRANQSDIYETGKDQRKSSFGGGIKNSVLYVVIVNSIVLEQDKKMCSVLGKGFVLVLTATNCSQIPSISRCLGISSCFPPVNGLVCAEANCRQGRALLVSTGWAGQPSGIK